MFRKMVLSVALCSLAELSAQTPDKTQWKRLEFLLGKWTATVGEKDTPLGPGQGEFSFESQLGENIIVRHNFAAYDSGVRHDDLLIVYIEQVPRAIYFDSEGHVIRYAVRFPSPQAVTFESDGTQPGPKFRLSYWMDKESLKGKFEVAPPGGEYKAYMTWASKKQRS